MSKPRRIEPAPGQESVWDYPRPPRLEPVAERIQVVFNKMVIVETDRAQRILETSHPPTYYVPPDAIRPGVLVPNGHRSNCEWKGRAEYYDVAVGNRRAEAAAWSYPSPVPRFEALKDHVAFFAGLMDACFVGDERVQPQSGDFYGGWVTSKIVGPFKGPPGTGFW